MSEPNNVVSLADWKAKHQRKSDQAQRVPVYVPVLILMDAGGSN